MRRPSKRFTACISLVVLFMLLPWTIIFCCGPVLNSDEQRFMLFNSGLDGSNGMKAFTYSQSLFHLFEADKQPDFKRNCREWVAYTNNQATEKDVFTIQYETAPAPFLQAYRTNNWRGYNENSFVRWLVRKENRAALDYMAVAKQAEAVDVLNADPWDTTVERRQHDVVNIAALANSRIAAAPLYLKQRYAFQSIKLWFYVNDKRRFDASIQKTYLDHLENRNTIVAAWAKIYYAMVQKDRNRRTLYLLKAFAESDEKKQFSYLRITKEELASLKRVTTDA